MIVFLVNEVEIEAYCWSFREKDFTANEVMNVPSTWPALLPPLLLVWRKMHFLQEKQPSYHHRETRFTLRTAQHGQRSLKTVVRAADCLPLDSLLPESNRLLVYLHFVHFCYMWLTILPILVAVFETSSKWRYLGKRWIFGSGSSV